MIFVELDRQTVERLIEEKRDRITQLDGEMTNLISEANRLEAALQADTKDLKAGRPSLAEPPKTGSGRIKRGESERLIVEFLSSNRAGAISLADLCKATGVKYGTAARIIRQLSEQKRIDEVNGKWIWGNKG
jgi:predicted transcriptional regulator